VNSINERNINIWHVGNWCAHWGNEFRESAFRSSIKNFEVLNYARMLVESLEKIPGSDVISIPSWELYQMSPEKFDERLKWADVIIFGDVETQSLQLNPSFFENQFDSKFVTFPDRFDILREWVKDGGHFHMNGGWFSFSGHQGYGGWGRSRWQKDTDERVLPVDCIDGDDLIESTASFPVKTVNADHPAVAGMDWDAIPPLVGFNETRPSDGAEVILEIQKGNSSYPLLAERKLGKGRSTAWMTGFSPHWGINFMKWDCYDQFLSQLFTLSDK